MVHQKERQKKVVHGNGSTFGNTELTALLKCLTFDNLLTLLDDTSSSSCAVGATCVCSSRWSPFASSIAASGAMYFRYPSSCSFPSSDDILHSSFAFDAPAVSSCCCLLSLSSIAVYDDAVHSNPPPTSSPSPCPSRWHRRIQFPNPIREVNTPPLRLVGTSSSPADVDSGGLASDAEDLL
jgi:hypothetical protein